MELKGFKCDRCGKESRNASGRNWHEVRSLLTTDEQGWLAWGESDSLHYCSKQCLKDAIDQDWK